MAADVTEGSLRATGIAMLVLTTFVIVLRILGNLQLWYQGRLAVNGQWWHEIRMEDIWLLLSYLFFVTVSVLYLYIVPAFFRLTLLGEGLIEPYATATEDALFIQKGLFAASACLWFCLWSAKFSLLCMYKKLFDKLAQYNRLWWALVIFSTLALVGCIVTLFEACENMTAWFSVGACVSQRDIVHAAISMWYGYAVDLLTDLLIMALPLRLLIGLQMPLSRKISISCLFCLGFVCIIASTIRVTQINNGTRQPTVPWLALWGTVESATAVVIANSPNLYRTIKRQTSRAKYYGGHGSYENTGGSGSARPQLATIGGTGGRSSGFPSRNRGTNNDKDNTDDVELKSFGGSAGSNHSQAGDGGVNGGASYSGGRNPANIGLVDPDNSSQEGLVDELRRANGGIVNVTVSGGKMNAAGDVGGGNWQGGGIVVTNTHVLQRTEGNS
ncbi:uncharacterized protein SPSK_09221 [Sporothrix schenckii 1099-18]|uniref:Rhodopsin domain-containing protein n=2 Tax=Sporothrix schenckii TaxID=29908 RepID=U7PYS5_SPOS1|nr:uncharacterized protein SPSK_09221 [Sporothrix schenckii 1099-18]ERS99625.1 hypothetical protein HMPREF1624_02985 [Sporothrix schenckii ATCC 58251]KJR86026.1 hypothetical protein SPSK_09221 [Sporothrix schenckii 1099-18]